MANIEEARYEAVAAEDGKMLVRARYAVRNNQRSFLAVTLPAQATLWSASRAGRPARPGVSPSGSLLLPLQKGRTGEDAPVFVVELVYLQRMSAWTQEGDARVTLPAVDLPVSRMGMTLFHSPRYDLMVRPGAFRVETDPGPWSSALRLDAPPPPPAAPETRLRAGGAVDITMDGIAAKQLRDSYRGVAGVVPVQIALPPFGSAIFVAAELTAENHAPALELRFRRTNDR